METHTSPHRSLVQMLVIRCFYWINVMFIVLIIIISQQPWNVTEGKSILFYIDGMTVICMVQIWGTILLMNHFESTLECPELAIVIGYTVFFCEGGSYKIPSAFGGVYILLPFEWSFQKSLKFYSYMHRNSIFIKTEPPISSSIPKWIPHSP